MTNRVHNNMVFALPRIALFFLIALLVGSSVWAGPLAPEMRVIASRDRDFIERSGAATIEELLNTGIVRYFYGGGQTLLLLIDGRPYGTINSDLDTIPLSAVERIELLSGETLGQYGGIAVNGAINVVMRKGFEGFETRALTRVPSDGGGESWQGSLFWGGPVNDSGGHLTIGFDIFRRHKIPSSKREFSRSTWKEGGTFSEARNVSIGGNTLYVFDVDEPDPRYRFKRFPLGECNEVDGYTGPLSFYSEETGDIHKYHWGCGFAYGNIAWNTSDFEQRSTIVNLDLPLDGGQDFHLYANFGQGKSTFRYAPSVGFFIIPNTPNTQGTRDTINKSITNQDPYNLFVVDVNDYIGLYHRFRGHGNRNWNAEYNEYDIATGISGQFTENLGYEATIDTYHLDGSQIGNTFVRSGSPDVPGTIEYEINRGYYKFEDPTSDDPMHQEAIRNSSLQEEIDFGQDYVGARLALEGQAPSFGDRKLAWTAGLDFGKLEIHSLLKFVDKDGEAHDVTEVLGSGGVSYEGERQTVGVFGDLAIPLSINTDFRVAARGDEYDDVGGLHTYHLSTEHRPNDFLSLRGSWGKGDRAPSMSRLHSTARQDHPYVRCIPEPIDPDDPENSDSYKPPRKCEGFPSQVTRESIGNLDLEPSETERYALGVGFSWPRFYLDVEWYQLEHTGLPGLHDATWALRNFDHCVKKESNDQNDEYIGNDCVVIEPSDVKIYDSYANVINTKIRGVTTRYRKSIETGWGEIVLSGAWRHVTDAELSLQEDTGRFAMSRNMVRSRIEAKRGDVTATWTVNYREGFRNQSNTGDFEDWLGHDVTIDWDNPFGIDGGRITAGVFNLTNASLSVDTSNPNSVDGPQAAGWGRTYFLTINRRF